MTSTLEDRRNINPDDLFEVFQLRNTLGSRVSIDDYVDLRHYADHEQSIEIVTLGNIRPTTYMLCLEYGNATHEEVVHTAKVEVPGRPLISIDTLSCFDHMVRTYVGGNIDFATAVEAYKLGIPNDKRCKLDTMLQHWPFQDIVAAWQQLTPRMNERTFCLLVSQGTSPSDALKCLVSR